MFNVRFPFSLMSFSSDEDELEPQGNCGFSLWDFVSENSSPSKCLPAEYRHLCHKANMVLEGFVFHYENLLNIM